MPMWKADGRWIMEGSTGLTGKIIARCEGDRDEAREHARLIAAAPDLLAASIEALARIESDIESDKHKVREGDMLRAAIKAARGITA